MHACMHVRTFCTCTRLPNTRARLWLTRAWHGRRQREGLRELVMRMAAPKLIGGAPVTGAQLADVMERLVGALKYVRACLRACAPRGLRTCVCLCLRVCM